MAAGDIPVFIQPDMVRDSLSIKVYTLDKRNTSLAIILIRNENYFTDN